MTNIDELEALAKAATPEDWFPETYSSGHRQVCGNLRPVDDDENAYTVVADVYKREDHEYLVAAQPKAVLALIAEVRALRKAGQSVLDWTENKHRPPVPEEFPCGETAHVRVHALVELHRAINGEANKETA